MLIEESSSLSLNVNKSLSFFRLPFFFPSQEHRENMCNEERRRVQYTSLFPRKKFPLLDFTHFLYTCIRTPYPSIGEKRIITMHSTSPKSDLADQTPWNSERCSLDRRRSRVRIRSRWCPCRVAERVGRPRRHGRRRSRSRSCRVGPVAVGVGAACRSSRLGLGRIAVEVVRLGCWWEGLVVVVDDGVGVVAPWIVVGSLGFRCDGDGGEEGSSLHRRCWVCACHLKSLKMQMSMRNLHLSSSQHAVAEPAAAAVTTFSPHQDPPSQPAAKPPVAAAASQTPPPRWKNAPAKPDTPPAKQSPSPSNSHSPPHHSHHTLQPLHTPTLRPTSPPRHLPPRPPPTAESPPHPHLSASAKSAVSGSPPPPVSLRPG